MQLSVWLLAPSTILYFLSLQCWQNIILHGFLYLWEIEVTGGHVLLIENSPKTTFNMSYWTLYTTHGAAIYSILKAY